MNILPACLCVQCGNSVLTVVIWGCQCPLELLLQLIVSHQMGAGDQTQVVSNDSKSSLPLSHLSNPLRWKSTPKSRQVHNNKITISGIGHNHVRSKCVLQHVSCADVSCHSTNKIKPFWFLFVIDTF